MFCGTTKSGFSYEIADAAMDNMEVVDALAEIQDGDPLGLSHACRLILGDAQRKALYAHLRTEAGNVPVEAVTKELIEMLATSKQGKNSSSSPA